jgi:plastocyanin
MKAFTTIGITTVAVVLAAAWAADHASASAPASVVEGVAKGKVKFEGKKPETKPLSISAEQAKGCCPPGKEVDMRDPSVVIGADDGLANVVVMIPVEGAELKPAAEPLHIDQKECHFEPHIQVVPVGGKVVFLNSDQVSHNVHTYANKNDSFNKTIAPGGKEEQTLAKADKIEIKCDIHPWMNSWVVVSDTPHYAITKDDGSFEIKGLKPGTYKAELWHEKFGKGKGEVVIKEDGSSDLVEIKMGEKKKKG